jgi:hypothetical protein
MDGEAAEASMTEPRILEDLLTPNSSGLAKAEPIKQSNEGPCKSQDEAIEVEVEIHEPPHKGPKASHKAKTPAPEVKLSKKKRGKQVAANTTEHRQARPDDSSDDSDEVGEERKKRQKTSRGKDCGEIESTNKDLSSTDEDGADKRSRGKRQRKANKANDRVEMEDPNKAGPSNDSDKDGEQPRGKKRGKAATTEGPAVIEDTKKRKHDTAAATPRTDSYRPSYQNNQRAFVSDISIISPKPMRHFHNIRQVPKPPVVLETRGQQAVGGRAPHFQAGPSQIHNHNQNHNHNQKSEGGQGRGQPAPQQISVIPRGPKNIHTQNNNRPGQDSGRKTAASSQANRPYQNSGANTPRWYPDKPRWCQNTPNNQGHGARTPAHTQDSTSHGGFGGRTPGPFANKEASQSWGGRTPHPNQHGRPNQTPARFGEQAQPFTGRGATGGIHHRFKEEENNSIFL